MESTSLRPPGLIATLVGGSLGGASAVWIGLRLAQQLERGDLSDIGTGLLLVSAGLIIGPSAGSAVALAITRHDRVLRTGVLVALFMVAAIVVDFALLRFSAVVLGPTGAFLLVALDLGAIWLARLVATR